MLNLSSRIDARLEVVLLFEKDELAWIYPEAATEVLIDEDGVLELCEE